MIGKATRPRDFQARDGYDPKIKDVRYFNKCYAWLTHVILVKWVKGLFGRRGRGGNLMLLDLMGSEETKIHSKPLGSNR